MDRHISLVGYLHIAYGVLFLLIAFIAFIAVVGGGLISGDAEAIAITAGVGLFVALILLIIATPSIIGGYGVLKRKEWGRVVVIILSVIDLFSFPIGTAIGGYSLWVLFQDEARSDFRSGYHY